MYKSIFFLTLMIALLTSCENSESTNSKKDEKKLEFKEGGRFSIDFKRIVIKDDNCEKEINECANVMITYPYFINEEMLNSNKIIQNRIADMMGFGDVESNSSDLDNIAADFIKSYTDFKKEFPDSPQVWNFNMKSRVSYSDEEVVSLLFASEVYTGGAHANVNQMFMNFDKNGMLLRVEDLVEDVNLLRFVAEKKFRNKKQIKKGVTYEEAGYNFPDNKFVLPANIGIGKDVYVLHYNNYEIASYASGPTQIFVTKKELDIE